MRVSIPSQLNTFQLAEHYIRLRDIVRTYSRVGRTAPNHMAFELNEITRELSARLDKENSK